MAARQNEKPQPDKELEETRRLLDEIDTTMDRVRRIIIDNPLASQPPPAKNDDKKE